VTLNWSSSDVNGVKTANSLTIDEIYCYDLEEIKDFRDCMINGKKSDRISGGGNSNWSMSCENQKLYFYFTISGMGEGMGEGATLTTESPCHLLLDQFNQLVDLMEYISRNEKYHQ
jgi:hypothetical protein